MQPATFKPGSLSARIHGAITAAERPLPRHVMLASLAKRERAFLNRTLDRLVVQGLVRETCAGFVCALAPPAPPPTGHAEEAPDLPARQKPWLAAIIARAHAYRRAGCGSLASALLARAAERIGVASVRADLLALADLFAAHRETFPQIGRAG